LKCNLLCYYDKFIENGFDELDILLEVEKEHLEEMGIVIGHQIRIMKELNILKQKQQVKTLLGK